MDILKSQKEYYFVHNKNNLEFLLFNYVGNGSNNCYLLNHVRTVLTLNPELEAAHKIPITAQNCLYRGYQVVELYYFWPALLLPVAVVSVLDIVIF